MSRLFINLLHSPFIDRFRTKRRIAADAKRIAARDTAEERSWKAFYNNFISQGDLCFDVGANVGNRVKLFLQLGAKVVAVEPMVECSTELEKWYGQDSRLTIKRVAVGAAPGKCQMKLSSFHMTSTCSQDFVEKTQASGRFTHQRWHSARTVEISTLDKVIQEFGVPRFMKIDIEGFEFEALQGLSKQVPALSFEFTPELMNKMLACVRRIAELGDYRFNYGAGEEPKLVCREWLTAAGIETYLTSLGQNADVWGDVYAKLQ